MASEDFATEGQIKRLYAVLHSVGLDPKQWKKDQNIASYSKLTRAKCSTYIDEVEALEAEQKDKLHAQRRETDLAMQREQAQPGILTAERGEQAEIERIRAEQGRAAVPAAPPAIQIPPAPVIPPNLDEWIAYYIEILARTTLKLNQEERIPDREKGFGTKFVYYSVKGALENGGDHEEQV